jgi:Flp pilus assembly pilin Flp
MKEYALIATMIAACSAANATVVPVAFTGVVTTVKDTFGVLESRIQPGMIFSGNYIYETTTADIYPTDPNLAWYAGALQSFSVTVGEYTINGPGGANRIIVANREATEDSLAIVATPRQFFGQSVTVSQHLIDADGSVFSSDALPVSLPRLSEFDYADVVLYTASGSLGIQATVTSLSSPEPSMVLLLSVSGLLVLHRHHRRFG